MIGGVYSYALRVLILKEWLSNGGQLKLDMELDPFSIFAIGLLRFYSSHFPVYSGLFRDEGRFLTCLLAGLISIMFTSPCHSGLGVVMHIAGTHLTRVVVWLLPEGGCLVVAGSCSAS